jgi:cytochrome c553
MNMHSLTRLLLTLSTALFAWPLAAQNLEIGKEINGTCAGCHGDFGQGGKRGEYPRIAGQHAKYLEQQLRAFRLRQRVNIPMYPYTQERELSDKDITDVTAYLAGVVLPTDQPVFKDTDGALARLEAMEKVMIIGRVEGDLAAGGVIYQKQCAVCHAKNGKGRGMFPMIVGQYTQYLARQMESYRKGERPHDEQDAKEGSLMDLSEQDLQNILAYLTSIQRQ